MPVGIKDLLMHDETLFKDARAFDPDYIPKNFNHRESQLEAIALCIRPSLGGARAVNAMIYGPPATGKTTAINKLKEDLGEVPRGERVVIVHVNCQIHSSKFSIFSQIHDVVIGHTPPETGVPFKKVYEAIFKKLMKENKSLIVALDDMSYLFYDRHANEVLYDILRVHEVFPEARAAVFSIVSDIEFSSKLEDRVRSVFRPQEIFFQPYKASEILDILKERVREGFHPEVIDDKLISKIADHAFSNGDLRLGIEILRRSAFAAENDASRKIKSEHVEKAIADSGPAALKETLESLDSGERGLLKLIATTGKKNSGELYDLFKKETGLSYTKFYRMLDKFESIRLIDTKFTEEGRRGRTRNIILRYEKDEILK
jgi:cell division control protein 6